MKARSIEKNGQRDSLRGRNEELKNLLEKTTFGVKSDGCFLYRIMFEGQNVNLTYKSFNLIIFLKMIKLNLTYDVIANIIQLYQNGENEQIEFRRRF